LIASLSPNGLPAASEFHRLHANGIPSAVDFPIHVLVHGGANGLQMATSIAEATPGVYTVMAPDTHAFRRGDDSLLTIIPTIEGPPKAGKQIVEELRRRLAVVPGGVEVGGSTVGDMAFTDAVYGHFPLLISVTSLVTFIILTRALRSPVLALKAVVMNVVSLGAAYGFMVYFWQEGHGFNLIYGLPATGAIRAWIPTVIFASLFGLSMDYEVFVLTRIREEPDRTGSTAEAVVAGSLEPAGSSPAPR
jgi:RND superfamily putative drug exporter